MSGSGKASANNLFGMFFGRPISQAILAFTLITLILPLFLARKRRKSAAEAE